MNRLYFTKTDLKANPKTTRQIPFTRAMANLDTEFTSDSESYTSSSPRSISEESYHNGPPNMISRTYGDTGSRLHYFETEVQRRVCKSIPIGCPEAKEVWLALFYDAVERFHDLDTNIFIERVIVFLRTGLELKLANTGITSCIQELLYIRNAILADTSSAMQAAAFMLD